MGSLLLLLAISLFCSSSAEYDVVTQLGIISGQISELNATVVQYLGIPYAEPPTGSNRFKPTVSKQPWDETLVADKYGSVCPQDVRYLETQLANKDTTNEVYDASEITSMMDEDCLYLNIYVPLINNYTSAGAAYKFPVMVYIHGGEYIAGSGLAYSGVILTSNHDVIVVTINYRLGAFGFLAGNNDVPKGNYGIMDQQMALKWVQDNIEAFNGDPQLVTIFGQGAGASSVHLHTITNTSAGLFSNAIVQSATYDDGLITQESAIKQYDEFMALLSIDSTSSDVAKQLQDKSWEEILTASNSTMSWAPSIGSDLFENNPREEMKTAKYNKDINILIGSNIMDGYHLASSNDVSQSTWYRDAVIDVTERSAQLYNWTSDDIDKRLETFQMFYGGFGTNVEEELTTQKTKLMTEIYTDQVYESWAQEIAFTQTYVCNCSVFKYHFAGKPNQDRTFENPIWLTANAVHGSELTYVFGFITDPLKNSAPGDVTLSRQMMTYWTNFAKTGAVNDGIISQWPSFKTFSKNESEELCRQSLLLEVSQNEADVLLSRESDKEAARTWDFWQDYYVTMGLSCYESEVIDPHTVVNTTEPVEYCEPGVWSDSGVEMSNDTAGILLIVFIVLTGFFMLAFLFSCHRYRKTKKKIKKLLRDDDSSVHSNAMTTM